MEKILKIKKNGTVFGVYDDILNAHKLGKVKIERVSNIEYNNDDEKWEVIMKNDDSVPIKAATKNEAYEKEVDFVNKNINELVKFHFNT